jgi:glycosyltransferase involved in cell wall biosynthesis
VSVAVSTYDRCESVLALLRALEAQTLPADRFEVVVADNGSRDGTAWALAEFARDTHLSLHVVTLERNQGPAGGRNAAWRATRGDVVAFTDDDCCPAPEWLEQGLAAMRAHDPCVAVGRTGPGASDAPLLGRPFNRVVRNDDARFFATCNVFYRRVDLAAVDGFDESFRTPAGEDTDLGLRVRDLGRAVVFVSDAEVHHPVRPPSFRATLRETVRWTGIPRVFALHPSARGELLHHRVFWKRSHPPAILAVTGLALMPWWRAAAVLLLPWLHHRLRTSPACPGPRRRVLALPGMFVIDVLEVGVMVKGSLDERTLVL